MYTCCIESATFNLDSVESLYCRFSLAFGPDWEIIHGVDSGISPIAKRLDGIHCTDNEGSFVWNLPINISFKSTSGYGWPRINVQLYGHDFFGRDVVKGYGSLLCPTSPGHHIQYIKTYTPASSSRWQQFMNWIMGTPPEFYDSRFVAQGSGRNVTKVQADGVVKVMFHVVTKDMTTFGYNVS